jgi:hypothetical protein
LEVWLGLVHVVQSVEHKDERYAMLFQQRDVVFNVLFQTKGHSTKRMFKRLLVVTVESEVEVVGSIYTNDSVFQTVELTVFDMFDGPLVEFLDWLDWRTKLVEDKMIGARAYLTLSTVDARDKESRVKRKHVTLG